MIIQVASKRSDDVLTRSRNNATFAIVLQETRLSDRREKKGKSQIIRNEVQSSRQRLSQVLFISIRRHLHT